MGNAANSATLSNGTVRTNAALNVGGRSISIPASMRFAANAPRIAAAAIFISPQLRAAVGVAAWLGLGKVLWDSGLNKWVTPNSELEQSDGLEYQIYDWLQWRSTKEQACNDAADDRSKATGLPGLYRGVVQDGVCSLYVGEKKSNDVNVPGFRVRGNTNCPAGWYVTPAGCTQNPQPKTLTEPEFIEKLAPWPMPSTVPEELPGRSPLPVERPVINPTPGDNPSPGPLFVPTGDPVPNQNYNPDAAPGPNNQPWLQPGVRITPRPTINDPWQVDIQPVERPQSGPDPLPDSEQNPDSDPNDKPKEEDSKSLCEKHPDIVACQKLGDVTPMSLAKNTVPLQINREDGFGPANGSCPAPKEFVVMGKAMAFRWDLLCDFATQIRPLLVGFAYLSAALAFLGLSRRD